MLQLNLENASRDSVDDISFQLEELGAISVTYLDQHDAPILEPAPGEVPLWPCVAVQALYMEEDAALSAMKIVLKNYPELKGELQILPEKNWERICLQDLEAQQFGQRLWVCPSWLTPPDPKATNLILDPGLAFGTGTHPTTALCLTWLDQAPLHQCELIDYGCGSGILSIAALKLGAEHVYAVDIDEQALTATQNNLTTNHIPPEHITIDRPDNLQHPVDCLIANILLQPLQQLKQRFHALLLPGGTLVVSGILQEQMQILVDTYQPEFTLVSSQNKNEWGLLVFIRE